MCVVNMRIASFDLGRKNFAVFIMHVEPGEIARARSYKDAAALVAASTETQIVHWENCALTQDKDVSIDQLIVCMSEHVRANWAIFESASCVVIEQQLLRNPAMKCTAHALQALFAFHGKQTLLLPAKSKFRAFPGAIEAGARSAELKRASVRTMRDWIMGYQGHVAPGSATKAVDAITGAAGTEPQKLDDLCDAGLQALSALYYICRSGDQDTSNLASANTHVPAT